MSIVGAELQLFRAVSRVLNGGQKPYGSMTTPFSDFGTGVTNGAAIDDSVTLAAGATMTLWEYGINSFDWTLGWVEIAGAPTGVVYLAALSDVSVSGTNLAAAGTAITWNNEVLKGTAPRFWGTRVSRTNATPANHAKTSGVTPNAWVGGQGEVDGFIYKIMAQNPGSTDLRVRRIFLG